MKRLLTGIQANSNAPADGGCLSYVGDRALLLRCEVSGSASYGISLVGHGEINHCTVTGCVGAGIIVDTNVQNGPQVLLTGNETDGNGVGIQADDGPFFFNRNIANNNVAEGINLTILGPNTDAASALGTEFANNKTIGNGGTGVLVRDEVGVVRKIEGGESSENGLGIDVTSMGVTIRELDILNNRKGGAFFHSTNGTFEFNTIRENGMFGVLIGSLDASNNGTNAVTSNKIDSNGGDGLHIFSNSNLVRHNAIKNNKGDGLQTATGAMTNTLIENALRDNKQDGIDNWGTATMMTDNVIQNSVGADLAGVGDGGGSCDSNCSGNIVTDSSGVSTKQELELDTLAP